MLTFAPTKRLTDFLAAATNLGAEASLEELFALFQLPAGESTLSKVMLVGQAIDALGLCLAPDLTKGEIGTPRRISLRNLQPLSCDIARSEIARIEANDLELKSSLMYHHKKAANVPDAGLSDLKSDEVAYSCLKTVAAFLTSNGGLLYVGVDDTARVVGIEFDFKFLGGKQGRDEWELHLRDVIKGTFKDGDNVNDYLRIQFLEIDGKCVARVEVGPRRRLSFLKWKGAYHLFRRQGNRTEEITIEQIEEFLVLRSSTV